MITALVLAVEALYVLAGGSMGVALLLAVLALCAHKEERQIRALRTRIRRQREAAVHIESEHRAQFDELVARASRFTREGDP